MRRHPGSLTYSALVALVALAGCGDMAWRATTPPRAGATGGGEVRGHVSAYVPALADKGVPPTRRLRGATVYLKNASTGVSGSPTTTDAQGRFRLLRQAPGRYELCAEAPGFAPSCPALPATVEHSPVVLTDDVVLAPTRGLLRGRVLLADGTPCSHDRPFFAPPTFATVRLTDGAGAAVGAPVTASARGEYVVAGLPAPGAFRLIVRCAGAEKTEALTLGRNDLAGINPVDVTLANSPPRILSLAISNAAGVPIRSAAPGDVVTVTLRARDPDGDPLHYAWGDGSPDFRSVDAPTVSWKLAAVPVVNTLFVEVSDGRGGHASDQVTIATGRRDGPGFTGRLSERSGVPLAGVTLDVDSTTTATAADGAFAVTVAERARHVMTVKRPGYALLSRVFTAGASNLDLRLDRMQQRTCDPAAPCALEGEPGGARAVVRIDPGSVVSADGSVVRMPFTVGVHRYDMAQPNPIPGDLGAFDLRGTPAAMISYGAVDIDLRDHAGKALKLAPGAKAHLSIPIYPARLATAPPTIPFLRYDETTGYWRQETTGTRVGDHYEATVTHLSSWNADVLTPNSSCIKVEVKDDANDKTKRAPRFPFTLHMDAQGMTQDFTVTEVVNVLYRLPEKINVTLEIHPLGDPNTVLRKLVVPSGPAIDMKYEAQGGLPPWPYDACNGATVLTLTVPTPLYPFLQEPGAIDMMTPTAYYQLIGARDMNGKQTQDRGNLAGWKKLNGFPQGEVRATYYNNHELQLGLDVHCTQNGNDVACYMTTYPGDPKHFKGVPDSAIAHAIGDINNSVTLAMEYSPLPNDNVQIVKFYAFTAGGDITDTVALDSQGPKTVPHACLACHYTSNHQFAKNPMADKGGMFLPFDPFGFIYGAQPGKTLPDQLPAFKALNALVKKTNPNNPITTLIDGIALQTPNDPPFVPPGWQGTPFNGHTPWTELYRNVVRPYCRGCHIAQYPSGFKAPSAFNEGPYSFTLADHWAFTAPCNNDPNKLCPDTPASIKAEICGLKAPNYYMPHGEVAFLRFWQMGALNIIADKTVGLGYTDAFNLMKNPCP